MCVRWPDGSCWALLNCQNIFPFLSLLPFCFPSSKMQRVLYVPKSWWGEKCWKYAVGFGLDVWIQMSRGCNVRSFFCFECDSSDVLKMFVKCAQHLIYYCSLWWHYLPKSELNCSRAASTYVNIVIACEKCNLISVWFRLYRWETLSKLRHWY